MSLAEVVELVRPVTLARDQGLPVLDALTPLLPEGLRRGSVVATGSTALALALAAAASAEGSWTAVVGAPSLGFAAALELGIAPERLLAVDPPGEHWATAVAALVDAVDLVLVSASRVAPGEARRLVARARERGAVLLALPGTPWPGADVRLDVRSSEWVLDGHLAARRAEVVATGRGAAARERRVTLWLPDHEGRLAPCVASREQRPTAESAGVAVGTLVQGVARSRS